MQAQSKLLTTDNWSPTQEGTLRLSVTADVVIGEFWPEKSEVDEVSKLTHPSPPLPSSSINYKRTSKDLVSFSAAVCHPGDYHGADMSSKAKVFCVWQKTNGDLQSLFKHISAGTNATAISQRISLAFGKPFSFYGLFFWSVLSFSLHIWIFRRLWLQSLTFLALGVSKLSDVMIWSVILSWWVSASKISLLSFSKPTLIELTLKIRSWGVSKAPHVRTKYSACENVKNSKSFYSSFSTRRLTFFACSI